MRASLQGTRAAEEEEELEEELGEGEEVKPRKTTLHEKMAKKLEKMEESGLDVTPAAVPLLWPFLHTPSAHGRWPPPRHMAGDGCAP